MSILKPFQLLEINVISAQDLEPVSRKMKTYATAWVHPKRKLSSRVDSHGHVNPTWNDKFVFRVDEEFLRQDTSAVQIELYAVQWFRDALVGTVRVLVGNLIPPITRPRHHIGMRFVALQVRRPSGRPQGILNIGVTLLDSSMRSMPLYTQLSASAVGYRDFMGEDENHLHQIQNINHQNQINNNSAPGVKPILRRTKSERSERVTFDKGSTINSSIVAIGSKGALENDGSILSISNEPPPLIRGMKHKQKASSVISGAELREKPKLKGGNGKPSSVVSDSIFSKDSSTKARNEKVKGRTSELKVGNKAKVTNQKPAPQSVDPPAAKAEDDKNGTAPKAWGIGPLPKVTPPKGTPPSLPTPPKGTPPTMAIGRPIPKPNGYEYGGPRVNSKFPYGGPIKPPNSLWSDSEVGPSPSEVAAAMAERRYPLDEERSSVLDGWSLDESVEGLRSKLERWRTELPPIYDHGYGSSSVPSTSHRTRRHNDGGSGSGSGMFSCFGNIYGYECQCICGKPPGRRGMSGRYQSPSIGSRSFF